jgi:hypothetical protein
VENCQGGSKVYTIKIQYTHHLSLLQMMSPPTPKIKKRSLKCRVSIKLDSLMIRPTHTHSVNLNYIENEIED